MIVGMGAQQILQTTVTRIFIIYRTLPKVSSRAGAGAVLDNVGDDGAAVDQAPGSPVKMLIVKFASYARQAWGPVFGVVQATQSASIPEVKHTRGPEGGKNLGKQNLFRHMTLGFIGSILEASYS